MRSIVCNPQLVAVCNQHAVLDVIHRRWYVINPKKRNIQDLRLDDIPFAKQTDYIRLTAITYQSFGLDKNKGTVETVPLFFVSVVQKRTSKKPRNYQQNHILNFCQM